jgi:hypothetical protein
LPRDRLNGEEIAFVVDLLQMIHGIDHARRSDSDPRCRDSVPRLERGGPLKDGIGGAPVKGEPVSHSPSLFRDATLGLWFV